MPDTLPAFCDALDTVWPWPHPLPGVAWAALRFDIQRLEEDAFERSGIVPPAALRRAAPKRRAEFLAGRLCARDTLARLSGVPQVPGMAESRAPLWPPGLLGSITHSAGFAAALAASTRDYRGLGLDAERWLTRERARRLADQLLTPAEREWLATLPDADQGPFVTLAFSLKESLFKALFPLVGVRFYFQDAELASWDRHAQRASLRLLTPLAGDWPAGRHLHGQYVSLEAWLLSVVSIPA